tara:strand:+ start:363 stop:596 length:234 start_codon:yes stop_codon:yes gene_type:complete
MNYSKQIEDNIYESTEISALEKIDKLLEMDATQYTNLGIESTKHEKQIVKSNSRSLYNTILKLDNKLGTTLLHHQDD